MKYVVLAVGSLIWALSAETSLAQDAAPAAESAGPAAGGLETVTVTARKRQENLEDTPIAITAVSADDIQQTHSTDISNLQQIAPSLTVSSSAPIAGASNAAQIFIRGIGQTDFTPNTEPGVGVYLDGVYMSHTLGSLLDLVDVDSVQVLRGPQGTLFGRNTIGGALVVNTKKPGPEFSGWVEGDVGTYGELDLKAGLNLPINDKIASSFSLGTENNDGWVKRLPYDGSGGGVEGNKHTIVGRGAIELKPIDALDILLTIDGTRDKASSLGAVSIATDPTAQFTGFYNFVQPGLCPYPTSSSPNCYNNQWAIGPYKTYANGPNSSDDSIIGTNLTMSYDFGPVTVKSITAYRNTQGYFALDSDNSPLTLAWTSDGYRDEEVSEELQVIGSALDGRLKYVGGLYYFDEKATDTNLVFFPVVYISSGGFNDNSSEAVFGQFTYDVLDNLSVTGGLRWTYDTTEFTPQSFVLPHAEPPPGIVIFPPGLPVLPPTLARATYHDISPEFNLSYKWTPDLMTYFNFSEGYKSGGFTQRVFPPLPAVPDYSPEYATVYELGLKTTLDHRFRINADVYHTDYSNVQILVVNGIAPQTENAAAATIDGAELEVLALPVDNLTLSLGTGYTFAHYTQIQPGAAVTLGDKFVFTPMWTVNASAAYDIDVGNEWKVTPRVELSYRSSETYDATNAPSQFQPGYALVNFAVTVHPPDQHFEGFVRINNAFDKRYLASGSDALTSQGFAEGVYGPPLTFVAGLKYKF